MSILLKKEKRGTKSVFKNEKSTFPCEQNSNRGMLVDITPEMKPKERCFDSLCHISENFHHIQHIF